MKKTLNKTIRDRSMKGMNERIRFAEEVGYSLVGKVFECRDGIYHALLDKVVEFGERK